MRCRSSPRKAPAATGPSFIALVATLSILPTIPVAGMALGIDRIMSVLRALMNMIGSRLAAPVLAEIAGELHEKKLPDVLDDRVKFESYRAG